MALNGFAIAFLLAFFSTIAKTSAQGSLNLTVTFYPNTGDFCNGTESGISFNTASVPADEECFNLAELFTGNSTFGFRNQTPSSSISQDPVRLYWTIDNIDAYDPQANYSTILYQQPVLNDNNGEGEGTDASRYFSVYNGEDCRALADPVQPWVGWTCSSSAEGECNTLPYSVASFKIDDAAALNSRDGKCWNFAFDGAAAGKMNGMTGGLAGVVSLAAIMFLLA